MGGQIVHDHVEPEAGRVDGAEPLESLQNIPAPLAGADQARQAVVSDIVEAQKLLGS